MEKGEHGSGGLWLGCRVQAGLVMGLGEWWRGMRVLVGEEAEAE